MNRINEDLKQFSKIKDTDAYKLFQKSNDVDIFNSNNDEDLGFADGSWNFGYSEDIAFQTTEVLPGIKLDELNSYFFQKENSFIPINDLYILSLFIQYCSLRGISSQDAINYLEKFKDIGYDKLIPENQTFSKFLVVMNENKDYYLNLLQSQGIDLSKKDVFELNKGIFDTCFFSFDNIISKYGNTLDTFRSIIYKHQDKIYKLSNTGNPYHPVQAQSLPEKSTFCIHNIYNDLELRYILQTLAGTDNTIVLGSWGLKEGTDRLNKEVLIKKVLKDLCINQDSIIAEEVCTEDMYFSFIKINTKNLRVIHDNNSLLSEYDKKIISQAKEKNVFNRTLNLNTNPNSLYPNTAPANHSFHHTLPYNGDIGSIEHYLFTTSILTTQKVREINRFIHLNQILQRNQNNSFINTLSQTSSALINLIPAELHHTSDSMLSKNSNYALETIQQELHRNNFPDERNKANNLLKKLLIQYALDNLVTTIQKLIDNTDKNWAFVTAVGTFKVNLNRGNIPHLLGFLSPKDANDLLDVNCSRLYKAIKEEVINGNKDYLNNIITLINTYKANIFDTIVDSSDAYTNKDPWMKIALKISNLLTLFDLFEHNELLINHSNNIQVYKGFPTSTNTNEDTETYLLLFPIPLETNRVGLVIEKNINADTFFVKSDVLISSSARTLELEGYRFERDDSKSCENSILLKTYDEKLTKSYQNTKAGFSTCAHNIYSESINKLLKKLDDTTSSKLINSFKNDISSLLINKSSNIEAFNKKLPNLLYKYFISCSLSDKEIELFYYLLAEIYFMDKDILTTIKICLDKISKKENHTEVVNTELVDSIDPLNIDKIIENYIPTKDALDSTFKAIQGFSKLQTADESIFLEYLTLVHNYFSLEVEFNNATQCLANYDNISKAALKILYENKYKVSNKHQPFQPLLEVYDILLKTGFLKETKIEEYPVINCLSFDQLKEQLRITYSLEQEEVDFINNYYIKDINEAVPSEFVYVLCKQLIGISQAEMNFVIYSLQLDSLKIIVKSLSSESKFDIIEPSIQSELWKIKQLNNMKEIIDNSNTVEDIKVRLYEQINNFEKKTTSFGY